MFATKLICRNCNAQYPLENRYSCEKCGGILEVKYDYEKAFALHPVTSPDKNFSGMWRYRALLPVKYPKNIVTLGEGETPLIEAQRISQLWGCDVRMMIKAEMLNPTGSFKDRPTSVGVSVAKEMGYKKIVVASSGNASAAASAYAARAGMECVVFIPEITDINKVLQAQSYGAHVICVKGNFSHSYDMAIECSRQFGWANVTSTFINPYTVEGDKVPAYELYHELGGEIPDYILIPIGSGPLLVGMYKGFEELCAMGMISRLPVMIGVQVKQCEPVTRAFECGNERVVNWKGEIHTAAGGISDPLIGYEEDGTLTLQVVRRSGGAMVSLNEEEVMDATSAIDKNIGLYCEPTGAVSVGAVKKLWNIGFFKKDSTVVSFVTGHGFKFSGRHPVAPPVIEGIEQLKHVLEGSHGRV